MEPRKPDDLPMERQPMAEVPLAELAELLRVELAKVFEQVQVEVADCPDLRQAPFHLASAGLGAGRCQALDVGGVPYLVPVPKLHRPDYSIRQLAEQVGFDRQAAVFGPASGPFREVGTCCELIANLLVDRDTAGQPRVASNLTHYARVQQGKDEAGNECVQSFIDRIESDRFTLLGNLFMSDGQPGPVLRVVARRRLLLDDPHVNGE